MLIQHTEPQRKVRVSVSKLNAKESSKGLLRPSPLKPNIQSSIQTVPVFTKTFTTGGSQAVRLPKAFRLNAEKIQIERNAAGQIVLTEIDENAEHLRLLELKAAFKWFADNPITDDDDFEMPPREWADFRNPFEKIAGEPPLTFAKPFADLSPEASS